MDDDEATGCSSQPPGLVPVQGLRNAPMDLTGRPRGEGLSPDVGDSLISRRGLQGMSSSFSRVHSSFPEAAAQLFQGNLEMVKSVERETACGPFWKVCRCVKNRHSSLSAAARSPSRTPWWTDGWPGSGVKPRSLRPLQGWISWCRGGQVQNQLRLGKYNPKTRP